MNDLANTLATDTFRLPCNVPTDLGHPILYPLNETPFLNPPSRTITETELSLLDDWCKENGATLIPGYEGRFSDGIGVAIKQPYSFDPNKRVRFILQLFDFLTLNDLQITGKITQTVIEMEWFQIFPGLIVTI